MNKPLKIPGLSLVDLAAAIGAFLLFDVSLIGYPSLPPEVFVFWDLSSQPIMLIKIIGVFIYPSIALGAIVLAFLLPRSVAMVRLKILIFSIILGLYVVMLLQNFQVFQFDPKNILVALFSALAITAGLAIIRQSPAQALAESIETQRLSEEQLVIAEIAKISEYQVEGWGLIIIGAIFFPLGLQGDLIRTMSLSLFLVAILYGILFLLSLAKASQGLGGESAKVLLRKYQTPTVIMEIPYVVEEEERKIPIKKKSKGYPKHKHFQEKITPSITESNPAEEPLHKRKRIVVHQSD